MTIQDALKGRDNNFNLIRFLAAFAVLFDHVSLASLGYGVHKPGFEQVFGMSLSELAVNMFFVLSGFLVTKSLVMRNDVVSYIVARFLRLVPAFAIMVLMTTFGIGLYFTSNDPFTYLANVDTHRYWIGTLASFNEVGSLPGVFDANPQPHLMNVAIWTLKYEVIAYIALLGLWSLSVLHNRTLFASVAAIFIVMALILVQIPGIHLSPHSVDGAAWVSLIRFGLCFLVGSLFYCYRDRIPLSGPLAIIGLAASYLAIDQHAYEVLTVLSAGYALIWASLVPTGKVRLFNRFGDYSYGVYIWHWPVLQALIASSLGLSFGWLLATTSAIAIALAICSWHLVEKPALGKHLVVIQWVGRSWALIRWPALRIR